MGKINKNLGICPPQWSGTSTTISTGIISTGTINNGSVTNTGVGHGLTLKSSNNLYSITSSKTTYHVLGEEITVDGGYDTLTAMNLSLITVLGKPYYDELLKNGIKFQPEITNFLNILIRDYKLDQILNDKI